MKTTKIVLFFFVFLLPLYGCGSFTCTEPALNKKISRDDSVEKFILTNGLTVVAKRMNKTPLVSMELLVKIGSAGEGKYLGTGISHFTEHMLFKGNKKYKAGDIARQIKQLGGDINGFTNYDCTGFTITVPRENLGCALDILSDMVFSPYFDKEQFDKERNVILNEIRMSEDDPERKISRLFWANAYLTHPYRHPVIGYRNLLAKLTPEDLSAFHKSEYVPNNMVLSVAGDFNREDLKSLLENKILVPERGSEKEIFSFLEDSPVSGRYYEEGFDAKIMYLLTGFQGIGINNDDLFALDILSVILGEGDSSRLGSRLRLKENIVYGISSFNYTPRDKGIFGIFLTAEYKNKKLIEKEIIEEIEKIKKYSVRKDELERAKNIVISRFNFARETVESQALELASNEFFVGDPDFSSRYVEGVKRVTREDLIRVARKYLNLSKLITVVLRPQDAVIKEEIKDAGTRRGEIEEIKFENGLTLLLREEHSLPLVSIRMTFLGGLRFEERKKNGLSNMCAQLLTKGVKGKTAFELADLVESRGGEIGAFSGNNSLGIYLSLLSRDASMGIRILSEMARFPSFEKSEIDKEKTRILAAIKSREDDPYGHAFKLLKKTLFLAHPYGMDNLGEADTIESLTERDLRDFFANVSIPSNCVMTVFGDFDKERIIKEVKDNLLSWHSVKVHSKPALSKEEAINSPRMYSEKTEKKQAIICIGFHAASIYSPDRYVFEVLNEILNGQGNRLFQEVREQLGLAYAVGATVALGLETGYLAIYAATSGEDKEKVKEIIFNEVKNINENGFSGEEIIRAKASLVGGRRRNLETNSSFSLTASLDSIYGLGFDNYKTYEKCIDLVTGEDLIRIARQYLNLNNYVLVELIP